MCDTLIPYVRTLELGQIFFLRCPAFLPIKEIDLKETVCPRHACCIFTPMTTASIIVDEQIELRLIDGQETEILFGSSSPTVNICGAGIRGSTPCNPWRIRAAHRKLAAAAGERRRQL